MTSRADLETVRHLAYAVQDVRTASAVLVRLGFRLLYDAARAGTRAR